MFWPSCSERLAEDRPPATDAWRPVVQHQCMHIAKTIRIMQLRITHRAHFLVWCRWQGFPSNTNVLSSSPFGWKTMTGPFTGMWSCIRSASFVLPRWLSSALLLPPVPPAAPNALTSHLEAFSRYFWGFLFIHVEQVSDSQSNAGAVFTWS